MRRGDRGEKFFVILDGEAKVVPGHGPLIRLRQGDFFGEMALLDGHPRSASIEATTDVLAMKLARRSFLKVLQDEPPIALAIAKELAGKVRRLERSQLA